ncbi:MAG TPA: cupredoxin family copper-binding protein [Caulobacteraceae bacterium]
MNRKTMIAVFVALLAFGPALVRAEPSAVTVKIDNFAFDAQTVTVPAGATVTWVNDDDDPHTVMAEDGKSFRSKTLDTGDRFSFTFMSPGTYGYFCSVHPHMTGKVVVKAP